MEKRLAGLGTPVFRLMLKRRDSKPKPKMPDAMISQFETQSLGREAMRRDSLREPSNVQIRESSRQGLSESESEGKGLLLCFTAHRRSAG